MTTKKDNPKITRKTLRRNLQERYASMLENDQYNGKYAREFNFIEATLADNDGDDGECQTAEDRQARQFTATCLQHALERSVSDTEFGERGGGSRPVVGTVPIAPNQLTGGLSCNLPPSPSPPSNSVTPTNSRAGGYDGGLTLGWGATWNPEQFKRLITRLESAKTEAGNVRPGGTCQNQSWRRWGHR